MFAYINGKNTAEIAHDLTSRLVEMPFSDIEKDGLRGIGIHSKTNKGENYIEGLYNTDDFFFMLDPFILGRGEFRPLNPQLERAEEGIILMYFNSLDIEYSHPMEERVKRKYKIFGPVIEKNIVEYYQSLMIYSGENTEPRVKLITMNSKVVPLYQKDFQKITDLCRGEE